MKIFMKKAFSVNQNQSFAKIKRHFFVYKVLTRAGRGYNFFRCGYDTAALPPDLVRLRLCGSIFGPPSANFDFHFATFFSGANPLNWHFCGGAPDFRGGICSFKENGGWRELRGET